MRDDLDPQAYCAIVAGWLDLGATLMGGCCGMGPDHIATLAELATVRRPD
jgi:S-methylmethionine-dependent homocysteine/selenocysteine methylase